MLIVKRPRYDWMGDLQPIYICRRLALWPGCGIGSFVANLDLDCMWCGQSTYFVVYLSRLDCARLDCGGLFGYRQR